LNTRNTFCPSFVTLKEPRVEVSSVAPVESVNDAFAIVKLDSVDVPDPERSAIVHEWLAFQNGSLQATVDVSVALTT
jgi:hypothetical protein